LIRLKLLQLLEKLFNQLILQLTNQRHVVESVFAVAEAFLSWESLRMFSQL